MLTLVKSNEILKSGIRLRQGMIQKLVPLEQLHSDRYQRALVKNTVNNIHRNMDEKALGVIHVGQRKGSNKLYVIDGQNRLAGLKARKESGAKTPDCVLCHIFEKTTYEEEAQLFEKLNTVRPVKGNDKFWTRLQYKAQPEVHIEKAIKQQGFSLDFVQRGRPVADSYGNGIRGMKGLLDTWNKLPSQLPTALELLREVWGNGDSYLVPHEVRIGEVIFGIAKFLHGRGVDNIATLSQFLKNRAIDIGAVWMEARRSPTGYGRTDALAEILANHCRGYKIRKAA